MLTKKEIKKSPNGSFKVVQLCQSVAICEALKGDINGWGNGTETQPAFVTYLGCKRNEIQSYVKSFNTFYRSSSCEVRNPKYLKGFEVEIKIKGIQRKSNSQGFGLNSLLESEEAKQAKQAKHDCINAEEIDYDEYQYNTTGLMQCW